MNTSFEDEDFGDEPEEEDEDEDLGFEDDL